MKVLQIALLFLFSTEVLMFPTAISESEEFQSILNNLLTMAEVPLPPQNTAVELIPTQLKKKVTEPQNDLGLTAQLDLQKWTRKWTTAQILRQKTEVFKKNYDYILRF